MVSASRAISFVASAVCAMGLASAETTAVDAAMAFTACPTAPATPEDRRVDKTQLKFATYNAEFMFLVGYGTLKCPGPDCKWKNAEDAQNHIKAVALGIKAMDADIINLNEVEDCAALTSLINEIAALGDSSYKPYLVKGTDTYTGQNSALITRIDPSVNVQRATVSMALPVANSKCPPATGYPKTKSVSKNFYTTFNVPGFAKPITVIGAHLLANPQDLLRCYEREGQAAVLASLAANATAAGHDVIISGDLNDFSTSTPDANDNTPISNVLGQLEGSSYYNVGGSVEKAERFSQWWDKDEDCTFMPTEVSTLDHIIVSNSLKSSITNVAYRHDLYQASCSGYNSDHYPITVTIAAPSSTTPTPTTPTPTTPTPSNPVPVPTTPTPTPTTTTPVTPAPTTPAPGFVSCPNAPATPEDRRVDKTRLTFSTFNAEFLFLVSYGSSVKCPGKDCKWKNTDDAQNHIKAVAKSIKAMDADIINLNEVEDCAVLNALIAEVVALGDSSYKPYLIKGLDTATGQNSALITRVDPIVNMQRSSVAAALPVANSKCPATTGYSKTKSVSKHFYTTFQLAGFAKPLTVIGAHFLANPQDKVRCFEREGQATVLAGIAANATAAGHDVIIAGDLNDFALSTPDANDNMPISNVIGILEGTNFYDVAGSVSKAERYSQWWDKDGDCVFKPTEVSTLDHILVSNSLKSSITNVAYRHDLYEASCSGYNSDHFPVTLTISAQATTPAPTTPTPTTPVPTTPAKLCDANLVSSLIYKNADFIACGKESAYPFIVPSAAPNKAQMDIMCKSTVCTKAFETALATNPAECVIPVGRLTLRGDLLDRVTNYCKSGVIPTPSPTTPAPAPVPVPTKPAPPSPVPTPSPISPICTQAALAPIVTPTADLIQCAKDASYAFIPPSRPTSEQLTKICASSACSKVFTAAIAANPAECTVSLGARIQYRADLLDVVASTCKLSPVPTPTTPAPTTPPPTTPEPSTPTPTTPTPTTPVPTTPVPTTPTPTTPTPTTPTPSPTKPVPGGVCGNLNDGPSPCPEGEYCQPWNPYYYQCRSIDAKCGKQEVDVDFYGDDIASLSVKLPEQCCDKCRSTDGCTAYTFVNYNADGSPVCYLKRGTGNKQRLAGAVSAVMQEPGCATASAAQCGSDKQSVKCCPSGEYCQPWNPFYYQCRPAPQKCAKQEVGVDYYGDDLETIAGIMPWECCDKCADTAGCKAYTFVNSHADGKSACYLKKGTGQKRALVGAVSSTVINPKPSCSTPEWGNCGSSAATTCCPSGFYCQAWNPQYYQCMAKPAQCSAQFTDIDFYGNDLSVVYGVSPADCCTKCSATQGCKAYTFVNSNPDRPACYLKSSAAGKTTLSGAVSGIVN